MDKFEFTTNGGPQPGHQAITTVHTTLTTHRLTHLSELWFSSCLVPVTAFSQASVVLYGITTHFCDIPEQTAHFRSNCVGRNERVDREEN